MRIIIAGLALAIAAAFTAQAAEPVVALVKTSEGAVFAVRGDEKVTLGVGQALHRRDVIETAKGAVGLTFKDGSRISIGPNTRIEIKDFQFAPAEGKLEFLVGLVRGTMLYVSGVIAKLSPRSVRIETRVATVAVRGTRFLVKVEE